MAALLSESRRAKILAVLRINLKILFASIFDLNGNTKYLSLAKFKLDGLKLSNYHFLG